MKVVRLTLQEMISNIAELRYSSCVLNEYVTRSVLDLIALLATFSNTSLCPLLTYVTEDLRVLDDPVARLDEVPNQSRMSA